MNKPIAPKWALHTARTNRTRVKLIAPFTTEAVVVGGVPAAASASHAAAPTTRHRPRTS